MSRPMSCSGQRSSSLAMSQKRFDALTDKEQGWVREAADTAMQVSVDATYDETTIAQDLCGKGTRFIAASPDQIAALRTSLQPVIDGLAADPANGALLDGDPGDRGESPESLRSPPCLRTASRASRTASGRAALQTSHPTCLTVSTG